MPKEANSVREMKSNASPAPGPAPGAPAEAKYSIAEAFDYFNTPDGEQPSASHFNNERCIRAVAFLLHHCSQYGNEDVQGFIAHGLGHVLEQCASDIDRVERCPEWLRK